MNNLITLIQSKPDFYKLNPASDEQIINAESELSLTFSEDYKVFLRAFGVASFGGHEIVGICNSSRLNVVEITKENKIKNPNIPSDFYVIEELNINGIIILQNKNGEVFQTLGQEKPVKIANSLIEYIG